MNRRSFCAATLATAGCVSMSTLQTASTVPEHTVRVSVAPEFGSWAPPGSNFAQQALPAMEVSGRVGMSDNTDLGFKAGNFGGSVDVKAKLLDSGSAVFAVEPGIGLAHYSNIFSSKDNETILNAFLAAYLGLRVGANEIVLGPKLILEHGWQSSGSGSSSDGTFIIAAGGFGVAFKATERLMIMPEINLGTVILNDPCSGSNCKGGLAVQAAIGFHFDR